IKVGSAHQDILISGSSPQAKLFGASPCWKDVTDDGKPDLVVGDGKGYLWIFEAKSKKNTFPPKFSHGRFIHTFLGYAMNIDVADYNGDGINDVLVGTPEGAIQVLRNRGNGNFLLRDNFPNYVSVDVNKLRTRQQVDLKNSFPLVMRGDKPLCIGSFVAPRIVDWNRDKRNDIIIGEGSYSANSVYLYRNKGNNASPDFNASNKDWLAYGMGREHLSPAYGDLDGDGDLDLLVGDRTGTLTWYENLPNSEKTATPYLTKPKKKPILVGGKEHPAGELVRPYLADVDGDGDLDLFLGRNDGCVLLSRNIGTKSDPIFAKPVMLSGIDSQPPDNTPTKGWHIYPKGYGNSAVSFSIKKETDPETGKLISFARVNFADGFIGIGGALGKHGGIPIEYDKTYFIKFRARGNNLKAACSLGQAGENVVIGDTIHTKYGGGAGFPFKPGEQWQSYRKTFKLSHITEEHKNDKFTGVSLRFNLDDVAPDTWLDITDIEIGKQ
ncbi:MAG: VCBS repeat-containing protein, partial [Victivallaceae bacterium]|nr:VCBS repeat-containing protein [Victivallaceae bacterium]